MNTNFAPYNESPVYLITIELEEHEIQAIQAIAPDFSFKVMRDEGWVIMANKGYHGVVFSDSIPSPGGIFINNRWEGFLYPNGIAEVLNPELVINEFINSVIEGVNDIVQNYQEMQPH